MTRSSKINELFDFLSDISSNKIIRLDTNTNDEVETLKNMKKHKLDFDDSLQYTLCKKFNLKLISFDKHFDKTDIVRVEPKDIRL